MHELSNVRADKILDERKTTAEQRKSVRDLASVGMSINFICAMLAIPLSIFKAECKEDYEIGKARMTHTIMNKIYTMAIGGDIRALSMIYNTQILPFVQKEHENDGIKTMTDEMVRFGSIVNRILDERGDAEDAEVIENTGDYNIDDEQIDS